MMMKGSARLGFQRQLLFHRHIDHHPLTPGHVMTANNAPTIEQITTPSGIIWRITYAGMVKEHRQEWQARWLYDRACVMYSTLAAGDA
jgi:superfamily II DNA helicase RecQ